MPPLNDQGWKVPSTTSAPGKYALQKQNFWFLKQKSCICSPMGSVVKCNLISCVLLSSIDFYNRRVPPDIYRPNDLLSVKRYKKNLHVHESIPIPHNPYIKDLHILSAAKYWLLLLIYLYLVSLPPLHINPDQPHLLSSFVNPSDWPTTSSGREAKTPWPSAPS